MSKRHKGYVVHLQRDIKEEVAQAIIDAIKMIKGVRTVVPIEVGYEDDMNRQRAKWELRDKLLSMLSDD